MQQTSLATASLRRLGAPALVVALALAAPVAAAPGDALLVAGDVVNVRTAPTTTSTVELRVFVDQLVVEREREGDWVRVEIAGSGGRDGWIHGSLLALPGGSRLAGPLQTPKQVEPPEAPVRQPPRVVEPAVQVVTRERAPTEAPVGGPIERTTDPTVVQEVSPASGETDLVIAPAVALEATRGVDDPEVRAEPPQPTPQVVAATRTPDTAAPEVTAALSPGNTAAREIPAPGPTAPPEVAIPAPSAATAEVVAAVPTPSPAGPEVTAVTPAANDAAPQAAPAPMSAIEPPSVTDALAGPAAPEPRVPTAGSPALAALPPSSMETSSSDRVEPAAIEPAAAAPAASIPSDVERFREAVTYLNTRALAVAGVDLFTGAEVAEGDAVQVGVTKAWGSIPRAGRESYLNALVDRWAAARTQPGTATVQIVDATGAVVAERSLP